MEIEEIFASLAGLNGPDTLGNIGSFLFIIIRFLLAGLAFGAIAYYWARRGTFKYEVEVFVIKAGKIVEVIKDNARELTNRDGSTFLQLKTTKRGVLPATLPKPASRFMYRAGKKNKYFLFMDGNNQLQPTKMDYANFKETMNAVKDAVQIWRGKEVPETAEGMVFAEPGKVDESLRVHIKPIPEARVAWARQEDKRQQEKLKERDRLKELLMQAAPLISAVITFLILFFMFKTIGAGFTDISAALSDVAKACIGV